MDAAARFLPDTARGTDDGLKKHRRIAHRKHVDRRAACMGGPGDNSPRSVKQMPTSVCVTSVSS